MGLIIRSSEIHAAGCYTTTPIRRGTRILEYAGPRIPKDKADELYAGKPHTYLFGLEEGGLVIDGHGMAMFVNHSCDPNCETEEDDQGRVWIVALRDIAPGEELTYDYRLYDGEGDEPCFCRSRHCRGTMYSPSEVRKRERANGGKGATKKAREKKTSRK
ncbi:MAG: SET domain-containing protein [Terriglobales bacterium]